MRPDRDMVEAPVRDSGMAPVHTQELDAAEPSGGLAGLRYGHIPRSHVRSNRIVEHSSIGDRTPARTRMNGEPCHPCHAVSYQVSQHKAPPARGLPHPYKGGKRTVAKDTTGDTRLTPKQRVWSSISHPTPNFEPSTGFSGAPESLPCFERTPWQG